MNEQDLKLAHLTRDDLTHKSANYICDRIAEAGGPIFDKAAVQRLRKRLGVKAEASSQIYDYTREDIAQWATEWLPVELGGEGRPATEIRKRRRLPMTSRRVQQLVRRELRGQFPELGRAGAGARTAVDVLEDLIRWGHDPQPLAVGGGVLAAPRDDEEAALQAEYRGMARPACGWRQALLLARALAAQPETRARVQALSLDRRRLRRPMNITIEAQELKHAARLAARVAPRRSFGAPDMTWIRLRAARGVLEVTASDLAITAIAGYPCTVEAEGSALVPAALFKRVVARFADEDLVHISPARSHLRLRSEGLDFKLVSQAAESFPLLSPTEGLTLTELSPASFNRVSAEVAYAASRDSDLYRLRGVWLESEGEALRWVALDGRRLATCTTPEVMELPAPVLLASEVFSLLRPSERVRLGVTRTRIELEADDVYWIVQQLHGAPPAWGEVVPPSDAAVRASVQRGPLLQAVRSVMVAADRSFPLLLLRFEAEGLRVEVKSEGAGEAVATVPGEVHAAEPLDVRLNGRFFAEALAASPAAQVSLGLADALSPLRLDGEGGQLSVLLPCRL